MNMADGVRSQWHRRRVDALSELATTTDAKSSFDAARRFIQQTAQMAMLGVGAFLAVQEEITAGAIVAHGEDIETSDISSPIWVTLPKTRREFRNAKRWSMWICS